MTHLDYGLFKIMSESTPFSIEQKSKEDLLVKFSDKLDVSVVSKIWADVINIPKCFHPDTLILDLSDITYCDGAGIALITKLQEIQKSQDKKILLHGIKPDLQNLLNSILEQPPEIKEHEISRHLATSVGAYTVKIFDNIKENIIFLGRVVTQVWYVLLFPRSIRWRDFIGIVESVGPSALPLIALIGFLVGLISTFQSAEPLGRFGAQIYIINLVGLGLVREMGPLMSAVLLAGRTASAFAAELGTMKINQEIDALTTMGLDSVRFLAIPRILAATLMVPFLNIFLIFFGLLGCGIVMHSLGYNLSIYLHQLQDSIELRDFLGGMIKTFAFGIVIASIGCLHGLKTRFGPSAVGLSTTQAVVTSIIMIVFVDGVFASIYYVLKI
jgi:phospholipid/cholesterol/gamma-HCH transport system permease protein